MEWLARTERLQARAAAGIPDLDRLVPRCRRQPGRVVREGHGVDNVSMALERLQARAPAVSYSRLDVDLFQPFVLEQLSNPATYRTK
jgi:hypothetical protein